MFMKLYLNLFVLFVKSEVQALWPSCILTIRMEACLMPRLLQISHLLLRVKVQAFRLLTTPGTDVEYLEAQLGLLMKLRSRNCERLRDLMVLEKSYKN